MPGDFISGPRRWAGAEIRGQASRAATGFREAGAGGGCVAVLMRNDAPFLAVALATRLIDANTVPINWHFTAAEIAYILRDCGARVLVAHSDLWAGIGPKLPAEVRDGLTVVCVATPDHILSAYRREKDEAAVPDGALEWTAFCESHEPVGEAAEGATFPVIYTSGTTGNPKGVQRLGRKPPSTEHGYDAIFDAGTVTLLAAPLYHSAPNRFLARTFMEGGTTIAQARFDAEETLALIEEHRVNASFMVPTMVTRLLRLPEKTRSAYDLSSLRHVVFAGAPFPPELKARLLEWWGPVVYEYYGSTEAGALTFATPEDAASRPGTVGKVLPPARVEILDEDRNPLPPGETGEVFGWRSDYVDFTYLNRPEDRAEIEHDGMVSVGDMGYLDEDGYLFISDRKRDMIIAGGVNIYPAHIEAALLAHPAVADAAVFGVPDPDLGEAVAAAVETVGGTPPDFDELKGFLADRIAKYMIPRHFTHEAALPRDPSGKLRKRELRDPYWKGNASRI